MPYQGWKNYETWAVALWLSNEQGSYEYWRDEARITARHSDDREEATSSLAQSLKNSIEESAPEVEGLFADLLNAAIGEVDWYEVAAHWIEDEAADLFEAEEEAE